VTIPPRATLLLYTDGLVERRRRLLYQGISRAAALVQDGRDSTLDDLANQIMSGLAPDGGYEDDVVLLLYRHPAPLRVDFPAESGRLALARHALRDWLTRCDMPRRVAQDVLIAAGEACANAIEHGHRDTPGGDVRLAAEASTDTVRVTVADTGSWKPGDPDSTPHRGRGIAMMRALAGDVTITPGPDGTTVEMHTRIP
jgi:anti-sigma regulatory factor (Ser/Thr protein kinase)